MSPLPLWIFSFPSILLPVGPNIKFHSLRCTVYSVFLIVPLDVGPTLAKATDQHHAWARLVRGSFRAFGPQGEREVLLDGLVFETVKIKNNIVSCANTIHRGGTYRTLFSLFPFSPSPHCPPPPPPPSDAGSTTWDTWRLIRTLFLIFCYWRRNISDTCFIVQSDFVNRSCQWVLHLKCDPLTVFCRDMANGALRVYLTLSYHVLVVLVTFAIINSHVTWSSPESGRMMMAMIWVGP